jgi:hypothetical protein
MAGDGFLVPANSFYTYQAGPHGVEVLEFRPAAHFDINYRLGEQFWQRLSTIASANHEVWRGQVSPLAALRMACVKPEEPPKAAGGT